MTAAQTLSDTSQWLRDDISANRLMAMESAEHSEKKVLARYIL